MGRYILPTIFVIRVTFKINFWLLTILGLHFYKLICFDFQYGGDVTRRMKLLANQAEGKRKMKSVANISIPRETFIDVLKR